MTRLEKAKSYIIKKLSEELSTDLHYHCLDHVIDVYDTSLIIAVSEGISANEIELLSAAAFYHDSGFLIQAQNHEELGCSLVNEVFPSFGFNPREIEIICGMIMATKIPQSPKNLAEEILCDADLDYLGRDDFWKIGNTLFEELKITGVLKSEEEWNKIQILFLESHHYFTETSINLRAEKKEVHLQRVKEMIT